MVDGDGWFVLIFVEDVWRVVGDDEVFDVEWLQEIVQWWVLIYGKSVDGYYNFIFVLYKFVCGFDFDVLFYWFCCIFDGGEDFMYFVWCLICMVVEDIGFVDLNVFVQVNVVCDVYQMLGLLEGELVFV